MNVERLARQQRVSEWCRECFGAGECCSVERRALRVAEEAIEAAQAAGCAQETIHALAARVFSRPVGDLSQEIGSVGITLLALAEAAGANADDEEARELARILSKSADYFRARHQAKVEAGV